MSPATAGVARGPSPMAFLKAGAMSFFHWAEPVWASIETTRFPSTHPVESSWQSRPARRPPIPDMPTPPATRPASRGPNTGPGGQETRLARDAVAIGTKKLRPSGSSGVGGVFFRLAPRDASDDQSHQAGAEKYYPSAVGKIEHHPSWKCQLLRKCRRWESNPHALSGAPDFESGVSAIPPLRRSALVAEAVLTGNAGVF